jgi:hypothetical protein
MAMDEDSCFDNVDVPKGSSAPMDRALAYLHETMAKITAKCIVNASIELCNHATTFFLRNYIKHSPLSFGMSQQICTPKNGISLNG